jgi:tetratricopeptide (TPR) repeat protein
VERRTIAGKTAAEGLLGQVEDALRAGDADRAEVPLAEADKRIAEGGADVLHPRLARCRTDFDMLRQLDRIYNDHWTITNGRRPEWETISSALTRAFADYGITPGVTPPSEAARRITDSLITEPLLTSLEVWFVLGARPPALRAVLASADPDEFRNEARATNYQRALLTWAFRRRPRPSTQPVWFAVGHWQDRSLDRGTNKQLLLAAYRPRPNNFPLLMVLTALDGDDNESARERAGWARAALAVQPRNVAAWTNLGAALRASGDLDGAIDASNTAIRLDRNNARAYVNLASALRAARNLPASLAACREAVRLDPGYAVAHYNLAVVLRDSGDVRGAIAEYRRSIELDPRDARAHLNLGAALADSRDLAGAIGAYKRAIEIAPKFAMAHSNMGNTLRLSGDLPGALKACQEAVRLDPKLAEARNNLGMVYLDQGKYPEAIACAREATRLAPKFSNAHAMLGHLLRLTGDVPGARAALTEAARLDPQWKPMLASLPPVAVAPPPREVTR